MSNWMQDLFHVEKPIIAMCHLQPLPGDPYYDADGGMEKVMAAAKADLLALQEGGVDGIMFSNEFSLPYEKQVSYVTVAAMGCIVGELKKEIRVPFGVNIVSNPIATIALAAATGADFVRSTFTGAYIGENGITDTNIPATLRRKKELGLKNLKLLFKVNPESDTYLAERSLEKITKSIIFHCFPDALCVSGSSAGSETDSGLMERVKKVSCGTPVFCNTGCTKENIVEKLEQCDGACVGTAFKKDGKFSNFVEKERVKEIMDIVKEYRKNIGAAAPSSRS